ncbi:ABC transporter substrate-binding protein [Rhodobacteraceae bacterium B1Z28]|uniref:ABC transporter substrate-binding protein n=1 Tax=Ruegeria haliotis TaxID=2747601 RepID=A0ABX2PR90_9RHOB|nr:ABC transporter substrate-binding protein [Ruegeria haliotis]NVO56664.1 ABC transporter substrate-binding protein [Ruegeria haliotis]
MNELKYLATRAAKGILNRRDFLGRSAALGCSAAFANTMLATAVHATGPQKGGHLIMGLGGGETTNTLDPATALSQVPFSILAQLGETLVRVAPDGSLDMRIAEEFSASADATVWQFKIRRGLEFHNGHALTADDVLKTMQRHATEATGSGAFSLMQGISSMRADGDVFEVTLSSANYDLPYLMSNRLLVIQPGGGMGNPASGIGSGPYRITVEEPGIRYQFERFENYWDDGIGHFDSTEIIVINDLTARISALQSGQVHMVNNIAPKIADLLGRAPNVTIQQTPGRGQNVFSMHVDAAPFDNNELRLALKHAINREELVEKILFGYGSVGNDIPVNPAYPLFDETIPARAFDLDKAAEHYKASGHDGSPIILHVSDNAFAGAVDAAQLFQQSAQKAGIPLEVQREPNDGYWSEVWDNKPFFASYWAGQPTQDLIYSLAFQSEAGWNETNFNNTRFDELLVAARGEADQAKRKEMYREMAMLVRDEGGLIMPMFNNFIDAHNDKIAGWEMNPNADMMNDQAAIKCWMA